MVHPEMTWFEKGVRKQAAEAACLSLTHSDEVLFARSPAEA